MNDPLDVLYVEDDRPSVHLLREAFAESGTRARVHTVQSAPEALAFLARDGPHENAPTPDLVLLDLDLGETSGFDVLDELTDREDLPASPVVMFTSSDADADVQTAYEEGADAFVQKPEDFEGLIAFADSTARFWRSVRTPTEAA